jgi:hypothetical protein
VPAVPVGHCTPLRLMLQATLASGERIAAR